VQTLHSEFISQNYSKFLASPPTQLAVKVKLNIPLLLLGLSQTKLDHSLLWASRPTLLCYYQCAWLGYFTV